MSKSLGKMVPSSGSRKIATRGFEIFDGAFLEAVIVEVACANFDYYSPPKNTIARFKI